MARQPTMSAKRGMRCSRSAHSAEARPSSQSRAGRIGRSVSSSSVTPSIWPESPMLCTERRAAGWRLASESSACCTAFHQSCGFCSDHSGCGRAMAIGASASSTIRSASSMSTALAEDVPMSMPRYIARRRQPAPRSRPSAARAVDLVDDEDGAQSGPHDGGQDRRLVEAARRHDDGGDLAQHLDGSGDDALVDRMPHRLAARIEEGSHDVADGARGAQGVDRDVARQAIADQQRAAAEVADAEQRHVVGRQSLEGFLEHVLRQDGVARARAAGIDRRGEVVALAVDAARELAGDLEGVELQPVGQAAHHGVDAELGQVRRRADAGWSRAGWCPSRCPARARGSRRDAARDTRRSRGRAATAIWSGSAGVGTTTASFKPVSCDELTFQGDAARPAGH